MILRTFVFRVKRTKQRTVVGFMRREALKLLQGIPACRAAFFCRNPSTSPLASARGKLRAGPKRKGEYMWVTVWRNQRAVRAAQKRKDWQRIMRIEEGEYFAGRPKAQHFEVLLTK